MGAEPWFYSVPYQNDIFGALQALRKRELEADRYFQDEILRAAGRLPATLDEVPELMRESGTRSILDIINGVSETPEFCTVASEPTSQPIALAVPTYLKNEERRSFSAMNAQILGGPAGALLLRAFTQWKKLFSSQTNRFRSKFHLRLTEHSNAMPASERCPGQPSFGGFPNAAICVKRASGPSAESEGGEANFRRVAA